jgi:hypothetical protein
MEIVKENNRFTQLLKALESGWEIEEPVLLGTFWRTGIQSKYAYHFVLRNKAGDKTILLSLLPSSQLLVFLAENKIIVSPL